MLHTKTFLRRGLLKKKKDFVPKFFPSRVDPFSEGDTSNFDCYLPLKCIKSP